MIATLLGFASWALIGAGTFFIIVGAVGILRMPDLFTRMHAVSVSETLGAGMLILGLMLQTSFDFVTLKLGFVYLLFFFTGPVVAHALAQAALHEKIEPLLSEDRRAAPANEPSGRRQ